MDQRIFVMSFLEHVFGGAGQVPSFDLSASSLASLFSLARRSVVAELLAREERNDNRIRADEYAAESARLQQLLGALAPERLSARGRAVLAALARAAVALRDPEGHHLFDAVLSMLERKAQVEEQRAQLRQERKELESTEATQQRSELEALIKSSQESHSAKLADAQKQKAQLLLYEKKTAEYKASLAACESHLQHIGFDPAIRHSVIASQFEALKQAEQESAPLVAELSRYGDLEPHLERAQARVDAAKATLAKLKAQYNMELAKLANVVDK